MTAGENRPGPALAEAEPARSALLAVRFLSGPGAMAAAVHVVTPGS